MFKDKKYYGEFLLSDEKISTNILADRLEKLETAGLISKAIDVENNSKNLYSLTQKGLDLMPMLIEMIAWAAKYDKESAAPKAFIKQFKKDREGLIHEILTRLKDTRK